MGDRTTCTESGSRTAGADSAVPRADEAGPDPGDDGGGCTGGGARLPDTPDRLRWSPTAGCQDMT
ncbi:hypothetical protein G6541_31735, partial [Streptomyces albidoflavus]|nr:hypothetical protein [Streptomyces albidoflavus]